MSFALAPVVGNVSALFTTSGRDALRTNRHQPLVATLNTATSSLDTDKTNNAKGALRPRAIDVTKGVNGTQWTDAYWGVIGGSGGSPTGDLATQINTDFGSFSAFKSAVDTAATGTVPTGWVLVGWSGSAIFVTVPTTLDELGQWGGEPIMALDVSTAAVSDSTQTTTSAYMSTLWTIVDWGKVATRYANVS